MTAPPEHDYPLASVLLGGYYHQDWDLDDPDPDTAVDRFLAANPPGTAAALRAELDRLRALLAPLHEDDRLAVLAAMYCSFYPPGSGMTVDEWLAHLQQRTLRG